MRISNDPRSHITTGLGEFFGTAFFLFLGVGGAVSFDHFSAPQVAVLGVPFCFGFSLFVSIYIWAKVSGGVFNPAVAICLMLTRKISIIRGIVYIIAELLGALVGSWLIDLVQYTPPGGATTLSEGVTAAQGLFLEMFTTSVLCMAVIMIATEKMKPTDSDPFAPFGIGMSLFVSALCAGPFTGASLNPARTFGPSIVTRNFGDNHWVYYVGPVLGACLAAAWYHLFKFLDYKGADPIMEPDDEVPENRKNRNTDSEAQKSEN